jgi:NADH-quinone oxidoreductase subunit E
VFKDTYEDLTPERLAEIIDEFEAGRGDQVPTGPQTDRFFSAPAGGFTSLTDETAVLKSTREAEAKSGATAEPVEVSEAARPKTDAIETNPAVVTPSDVKVSPKAEAAASVNAPVENAAEADKSVDGKPRAHPDQDSEPAAFKAPEASKTPAKPSLDDPNRPAGVERPAQFDDLKLISGVGPKIEATLHSLGIYTFAQVAAWTAEQRAWVDGYLNFKGRIDRDDWVKQAEALAKGGEAEYIRVFGKKPV